MPLYVKIDVTEDGILRAWVSQTTDFVGLISVTFGKSIPETLRNLAKYFSKRVNK